MASDIRLTAQQINMLDEALDHMEMPAVFSGSKIVSKL